MRQKINKLKHFRLSWERVQVTEHHHFARSRRAITPTAAQQPARNSDDHTCSSRMLSATIGTNTTWPKRRAWQQQRSHRRSRAATHPHCRIIRARSEATTTAKICITTRTHRCSYMEESDNINTAMVREKSIKSKLKIFRKTPVSRTVTWKYYGRKIGLEITESQASHTTPANSQSRSRTCHLRPTERCWRCNRVCPVRRWCERRWIWTEHLEGKRHRTISRSAPTSADASRASTRSVTRRPRTTWVCLITIRCSIIEIEVKI